MGNTKKPSQSFWSTEDLQDIASHYPTKDFNQYSPTYNQDVYEKTPLNPDVVRKGYLSKDSKGNITKVPGNPNYGKENSVASNKPTVAEGGTYQKEEVDKYGRALPASGSKITTDATGRQTQWDSRGEGTPASKPSQSFLPKSGRDWDKNPPVTDSDVIHYEKDIGMPKGIGMMDIEKMPEGPAKQKALKDNADFHKQADAKADAAKLSASNKKSGGDHPQNENPFSGIPKLSNQGKGTPGGGDPSVTINHNGDGISGSTTLTPDSYSSNTSYGVGGNSVVTKGPTTFYHEGKPIAQTPGSGGWNNGGGMGGGQGGGQDSSGGGQMAGALIGYLKKKKEGNV